jgi:hypothetical protein
MLARSRMSRSISRGPFGTLFVRPTRRSMSLENVSRPAAVPLQETATTRFQKCG